MGRVRDAFTRITTAHGDTDDDAHVLVVGHGLALGAYLWTVDPSGLSRCRTRPCPRSRCPTAWLASWPQVSTSQGTGRSRRVRRWCRQSLPPPDRRCRRAVAGWRRARST
ncbi:hypothetical protein [Isoptericola variabilis]|uniref:hypothetical protein n=1 Tax=Isoptericola variabilis TaxID=139208 RepID=UPI001E540763|nr:hypothetical protein [Isoptericola variabilis]